jgi:hypothetical protein
MISVIALSAVDRGFEPWSGRTKDYKIGICCLSARIEMVRIIADGRICYASFFTETLHKSLK